MSTLSPRVLAICRTYWRTRPDGRVADGCCAGCPLASPCSSPLPGALSLDAIRAHADAIERAALASEAA